MTEKSTAESASIETRQAENSPAESSPADWINASAAAVFERALRGGVAADWRIAIHEVEGATIIDAGTGLPGSNLAAPNSSGANSCGSIAAGLWLAKLCLAGRADVSLQPAGSLFGNGRNDVDVANVVHVSSDDPVHATLGSQYAGWPVSHGKFFAMGSGPMRLRRGREDVLSKLSLIAEQRDAPEQPAADQSGSKSTVGILECDTIPDAGTVRHIARQCRVSTSSLKLAVAPSHSIAGAIQVVARSVETSLHKLHELGFNVHTIVSATGSAPLPPIAATGDTIGGIGRTNDAILYGGVVTLWVDADDDSVAAVIDDASSSSSKDHGRPFAKIFKSYDFDFYKVDPLLFSPAIVIVHSLRTGKTFRGGELNLDCLAESFGS